MPVLEIEFNQTKIASIAPKMANTIRLKRVNAQTDHHWNDDDDEKPLPLIKKRRLLACLEANSSNKKHDKYHYHEVSNGGVIVTPSYSSNQKNKMNNEMQEDHDLTNLNWLQDANLLNKFFRTNSTTIDPNNKHECSSNEYNELAALQLNSVSTTFGGRSRKTRNTQEIQYRKPPYSYSALIFMAIESSPSKSMVVRDIYKWIVNHFPYFATAPSGWKNTIRHTLSLRKCFKKIERFTDESIKSSSIDHDSVMLELKGTHWYVDGNYRTALRQLVGRAQPPNDRFFNTNHFPQTKRNGGGIAIANFPFRRYCSKPVQIMKTALLQSSSLSSSSNNTPTQIQTRIGDRVQCSTINNNNNNHRTYIQVPVIHYTKYQPVVVVNPFNWTPANNNGRFNSIGYSNDTSLCLNVHRIDHRIQTGSSSCNNNNQTGLVSNSGLWKAKNSVSLINVNQTPKVFAPVPIANFTGRVHLLLTNESQKSKCMFSNKNVFHQQQQNDNSKMIDCDDESMMHKTTKFVQNGTLKKESTTTVMSSSTKNNENDVVDDDDNGNEDDDDDDDDDLLRDGAQALLNFATGAFHLNQLFKQEE